ncbi:GPALPP motifs-containing protein 1 [Drosophila biarmipes]|uniref:GPALPP motifs-containing protein 1 n=1 Tax=Drosophila biarmipes TaxID=125945 RepID=UPI0007E696E0|nr:GPALPP motifs-containing protein 1 [Drosophila biarmipes]XP_043947926.1 GPALPP motifs-containing protein 1 [Drosophila biarmipes]
MSSDDSCSDSSSSSDERHRKRKHKKHSKDVDKSKKKKSKKHKKEKRRHKEKKRSRQDEEQPVVYAQPPALLSSPPPGLASNREDAFGPALPPHLRKPLQEEIQPKPQPQAMIGPIMPSSLTQEQSPTKEAEPEDADDLAGTFGPLPNASQVALEERALALKLAALEGGGLGTSTDQEVREEWMLELPEVGLKSGLAALSNMKRTFHQGKERPDFSDRSSWTKTPQSEAAAAAAGPKSLSSKELEQMAQAKYEQQRDDEQESMAKKHKKKHKREESLVELHQKKLRKEQREKEKELAASGSKPERRPFSRDVDLKLNKIDKNQTKQIVDKAKILNTKFSRGQAKYL